MAPRSARIVSDTGKHLAQESRPSKDFIIKSLMQTASALSELNQSSSLEAYISPLNASLVKHHLLQHKDKDVRLLVAICLSEIIRVLAPEPPFSDKLLRDVFKLFVSVFADLSDKESPYFSKRVKILETVAELKFCLQMLDIGCADLVLEMFNVFFSIVREDHQPNLVNGILSIMTQILKEEVSWPLLEVIFQNFLKQGEGASHAASQLSVSVIKNCAQELEPCVCGFLISCISDKDAVESDLKDFYHDIIFWIFQCAPQMLLAVIPSLTQELLTDQVDARIKAVNLIGKLFALPGYRVTPEYRHLFAEFLKRFSDKSAAVRLNALQRAGGCYLANPCGTEAVEILAVIEGLLLDFDDSVRTQAVTIACDLAKSTIKYVPTDLISRATERLRDKKIPVRKNALQKLLELYRYYCTSCSEAQFAISEHFEQIPCKILMLCYDKDCKEFRTPNLEVVLAEDLFPTSISVLERMEHWVYLFSLFNPVHVKALNTILSQKRRLQTELQNYLALRIKGKDIDLEEVQKKIKASFMKMSICFPDPSKAEECFHKLDQMKDDNILDSLGKLLYEVTMENSQKVREKLMKTIGDKHSLFDFLCSLSAKCSFNIFSSEHVRCALDNISSGHMESHSINLLVEILSIFPTLLRGSEKLFQELFEREPLSDKLVQLLAIVGPHVAIKLSDLYPSLEKICLEGTRAESKFAVSAISSLSCAKHDVFSKLYKKLINYLRAGRNIPTVLQSLGCIAQLSFSTFQTHYNAIKQYINENIFQASEVEQSENSDSIIESSSCCSYCNLKIYALKTLVKGFLVHEGIHDRCQIIDFLDVLSNMIEKGEVFEDTVSREIDKDHLRFAAAKSVLRLSRRWDFHIYPQIFRSTVLMAKCTASFVRSSFIGKIHKLLRVHAVPCRYACAFALAASNSLLRDSLKYMMEFVEEQGKEAQLVSLKQGGSSIPNTDHPVYIIVYLIHVLAHDTSFPPDNCMDDEKYSDFCRPLFFALWALVNASTPHSVDDIVFYLRTIFRAIKKAEDAVDASKTPMVHLLSDIGIMILDIINKSSNPASHAPMKVLLPSSIYRYGLANTSEEVMRHTLHADEQSFLKRIADKLFASWRHVDGSNELILASCKQNNFRTNGKKIEGRSVPKRGDENHKRTRGNTKQIVSNNASGLIRPTRNRSPVDEIKLGTEKEQVISSCESVKVKLSLTRSEVLTRNTVPFSSDRKNNSITEKRAGSHRPRHKGSCSSKDAMCKSELTVGQIQLSSPDGTWDPQKALDASGDDIVQRRTSLRKREGPSFKKSVPSSEKRKRGRTMGADPPSSRSLR